MYYHYCTLIQKMYIAYMFNLAFVTIIQDRRVQYSVSITIPNNMMSYYFYRLENPMKKNMSCISDVLLSPLWQYKDKGCQGNRHEVRMVSQALPYTVTRVVFLQWKFVHIPLVFNQPLTKISSVKNRIKVL